MWYVKFHQNLLIISLNSVNVTQNNRHGCHCIIDPVTTTYEDLYFDLCV